MILDRGFTPIKTEKLPCENLDSSGSTCLDDYEKNNINFNEICFNCARNSDKLVILTYEIVTDNIDGIIDSLTYLQSQWEGWNENNKSTGSFNYQRINPQEIRD